jgi:low temperature requirement protein LtrA
VRLNIRVLREGGDERSAHVTNMELFFDLVYVFAFTQVSEYVYEHRTATGLLQALVLFLALWWGWNNTAWATNWIDPERIPVVVLMSVLMFLSLEMSTSILHAFDDRGLLFAGAYVATQLLRAGFMVLAFGSRDPMGRNYLQLFAWAVIAGMAWVAGGIVHDPDTRLAIWAGAVVIEYAVPLMGFRLPGVEAVPIERWTLVGAHIAERYQLVLMVAFGETMLRVGEAYAQHHGTFSIDASLAVAFILIFSLWLLYFLRHAERSADVITSSGEEAARLGRSAYTYGHTLMVGALILVAVAIHRTVETPDASVTGSFALICLGGPALYLLGIGLGKLWLGHGRAWPPIVGAAGLVIFGVPASQASRLVELTAAAVVSVALSLVAAREYVRERPAPSDRQAPSSKQPA